MTKTLLKVRYILAKFQKFSVLSAQSAEKISKVQMYLSIYITWDTHIALMTSKKMPHHSCI